MYGAIPDLIEQLVRQAHVQDAIIRDYNTALKKIAREREQVAARQSLNSLLGFTKMFVGGMPVGGVYEDNGRRVYMSGIASERMFTQGMTDVMGANLDAAHQQMMLTAAGRMTDAGRAEADQLAEGSDRCRQESADSRAQHRRNASG